MILLLAGFLLGGEMTLEGLRWRGFDPKTRKLLWELTAELATRSETGELSARGVRLKYYGEHPCLVTAVSALVLPDNQTYQLSGEVKMNFEKEQGFILTDEMLWDNTKGIAVSKSTTWLVSKEMKSRADGLEYLSTEGQLRLIGNVETLFASAIRSSFIPGPDTPQEATSEIEPPSLEELSSGKLRERRQQEIFVSSIHGALLDRNTSQLTYFGNVRVESGEVLEASKLIVHLTARNEKRQVKALEALGDVLLQTQREKATADALYWDPQARIATLTSPLLASVKRENELLEGKKITRNYTTDTLICTGKAHLLTKISRVTK